MPPWASTAGRRCSARRTPVCTDWRSMRSGAELGQIQPGTAHRPNRTMEHPMRDARRRVVIEHVDPEIDAGRFPIKRTAGERVVVEADAYAEGHDELACVLLHRPASETEWEEAPMRPLVNDRWRGEFHVGEPGRHVYTLEGWIDHFHTWVRDLVRRMEAGQDVTVDLQIGAGLVAEAATRAPGADAARLREYAAALAGHAGGHRALSLELAALMAR